MMKHIALRVANRYVWILLVLAVTTVVKAQGGPPMITDDPGTPGNRKWEINVAYTTERSKGSVESETPLFDINYGYGDRIQFKIEFPWLMTNTEENGRKQGLGDTCVGIKWRFYDEGEGKLAASVYPQYAFNTLRKSVNDKLVESDECFMLPFQVTRSFGWLDVNADCGYEFHKSGPGVFGYGLAFGHEFEHGIEAAVEYRSSTEMDTHDEERLVNAGMRFRITEGRTFLVSCGQVLGHHPRGDNPWVGFVGLQFNF